MTGRCDVLLLVAPNASVVRGLAPGTGGGFIPPVGFGYLAASLEAAGYVVEIADMDAQRWKGARLAEHVRERRPRVVGISTMVGSYNNGLRAARLIRQELPDVQIVVGGPQATFLVEETLACPAVDVVVRHEGEETLLELMQHFNGGGPGLDQVRGIAFRDGGEICQTATRPLIRDLDRLPFPARHLFQLELYSKPGVIITSRGCVGQCVFCASRAMFSRPAYRARSPQSVVAEIYELLALGIREFFIADDAFTVQASRAEAICDLIIQQDLKVHWTCEARVSSMTPGLVDKMRAAGCYQVFYGVETGNAEIMRKIDKRITLEQVQEVVNFTQAAGLDVICSFIIGFPWDTYGTSLETIEFAHRLRRMGASRPNRGGSGRGWVTAAFYQLTPLPGTYLYDHADDLGIRFLSRNWDQFTMAAPIIETTHLSVAQMRSLRLLASQNR